MEVKREVKMEVKREVKREVKMEVKMEVKLPEVNNRCQGIGSTSGRFDTSKNQYLMSRHRL